MSDPMDYPHRFDTWPSTARVEWVELAHGRVEILREIGRLAEIDTVQERDLEPSNSRMTKSEIARVLLALRDKDRAIDNLGDELDSLERRYERLREID